ncbi:MAG: hypothetical protein IJ150_04845 [Bacteroidales bacterium]|nr:hypothetical protein [Bacteroidales bacterium]
MKKTMIFKALMVLIVIMLGANFNAEAQIGDLIRAGKNLAKQNKAKKENQAAAEALEQQAAQSKLAIPQAIAGGQTAIMTKGDSEKPTAVATWNPATLELTMATTLGGNTPGAVYKVDPNTGKVTDKDGKSKGSMNADGTIESPNLGTINVIPVNDGKAGFDVKMGDKHIGKVSLDREVRCHYNSFNGWGDWGWRNEGLCTDKTVNPLLVAYVYFGLIFTKGDINVNFYGYDPDKKYTVEELEDKIEWKNASAENEVMEYESSRPYAGFDREKFPHLKNCKVAAVGLMSDWKESKTTHTSGTDYAGTTWHKTIQYWVVYELTDGRNIVAFNYLDNYYGKEEGTKRGNKEWHDVSDWQRKKRRAMVRLYIHQQIVFQPQKMFFFKNSIAAEIVYYESCSISSGERPVKSAIVAVSSPFVRILRTMASFSSARPSSKPSACPCFLPIISAKSIVL